MVRPPGQGHAGHGLGRIYYLKFGIFIILVCYIVLVIDHIIIDKYLSLISLYWMPPIEWLFTTMFIIIV